LITFCLSTLQDDKASEEYAKIYQLRLLTAAHYLKHGSSQVALDYYLSILKVSIPKLKTYKIYFVL